MYCKKCGNKLPDDGSVRFCGKCGTMIATPASAEPAVSVEREKPAKITEPETEQVPVSEDNKKKSPALMITIIAIATIVVIGAGVAFGLAIKYGYFGTKSEQEQENETAEETSAKPIKDVIEEAPAAEEAPVADTEEVTNEADTEKAEPPVTEEPVEEEQSNIENNPLLSEFSIDPNATEDYSLILDPDDYLYYTSGIGNFSFRYPAKLYNTVEVNDSSEYRDYGEHIRSVKFSGNRGAELTYSVYKRSGGSIDDAVNSLHALETSKYHNMADIVVSSDPKKGGKIIMSGYTDSSEEYMLYDLIGVDDNYVYRMKAVNSNKLSESEKTMYGYYIENIYRMCSFSGSTKPARSYDEYLEDNR